MINKLKLNNVGPASKIKLDFGTRLNIFTGDNGLGKSFLLDIIWWAMTRKWPAEVNKNLVAGKQALPTQHGEGEIDFSITGKMGKILQYHSKFDRPSQAWTGKAGRPVNPGLVIYAMSDGSFAVWDPARNYWRTTGNMDVQERLPAYVFSPTEIWDGLYKAKEEGGICLCNGLIRDWDSWQKENGATFKLLKKVLKLLSPSSQEQLEPGEKTRISHDDARDMPTIKMSYGQDVPVVHASSGMRRIMALTYLLVWTWQEHKEAAKLNGEKTTNQVTFLIDEIESHLHPSWQLSIVPALLKTMDKMTTQAQVQLIAATHSPLVMTSLEPLFDEGKDAWFDLDLENKTVKLRKREFEKHGEVDNWLTSEAFDLLSIRAREYAELLDNASSMMQESSLDPESAKAMYQKLLRALNPKDSFLFRWRAFCEKKGIVL